MRLFSIVFDWKKWTKRLLFLFAIFIVFTLGVDFYVTSKIDKFIYSSVENTPKQKVALLLT